MDINLVTLKSALVSAVLMAIITVAGYVIQVGSVFALDWRTIVNLATISLLTALVSILKNMMTNSEGIFLGLAQVK